MGYIHHHTRPCTHPDRRDSPPRTRHGGERTAVPKGAMTGANAWIRSLVPVERSGWTGGDWSGMERPGGGWLGWDSVGEQSDLPRYQVPWALRPSPASGHPSRCLLDRTGPPARGAGRPVTWQPGAGQYLQSMPHQVGTSYTSRAQEGWAWSSCSDGPSCSPNRAPFQHGDADSPRRSDGACDCGMYSIDCVRKAHPQARPFSFVCVCAAVERCASRPVCVVVTWFGSHAKFRTVM